MTCSQDFDFSLAALLKLDSKPSHVRLTTRQIRIHRAMLSAGNPRTGNLAMNVSGRRGPTRSAGQRGSQGLTSRVGLGSLPVPFPGLCGSLRLWPSHGSLGPCQCPGAGNREISWIGCCSEPHPRDTGSLSRGVPYLSPGDIPKGPAGRTQQVSQIH